MVLRSEVQLLQGPRPRVGEHGEYESRKAKVGQPTLPMTHVSFDTAPMFAGGKRAD